MFILSEKYGRLCNRLMISAHVLACAIESEHMFVNLAFYEFAQYFKFPAQDILCRYPPKASLSGKRERLGRFIYKLGFLSSMIVFRLSKCRLGPSFLSVIRVRDETKDQYFSLDQEAASGRLIRKEGIVFFQGWYMRGNKNLEKHADKVREYFQPLDSYQHSVNLFVSDLRSDCDVLIGVVVRHGDYKDFLDGKYYYSLDCYVNFMKQIIDFFPEKEVKFLICSGDDKDEKEFSDLNFLFRSGHMIENLYSLASCDYIISPPSTYGMWASFYGKVPFCFLENSQQTLRIEDFKVCML